MTKTMETLSISFLFSMNCVRKEFFKESQIVNVFPEKFSQFQNKSYCVGFYTNMILQEVVFWTGKISKQPVTQGFAR